MVVDPGSGHLHIIRNEGSVPASTIAVQLVPYDPAKANRRIDAPAPETCSNIM
jgi:mannose-6-phosphate isomerase-like protein (cupin superfamily)